MQQSAQILINDFADPAAVTYADPHHELHVGVQEPDEVGLREENVIGDHGGLYEIKPLNISDTINYGYDIWNIAGLFLKPEFPR